MATRVFWTLWPGEKPGNGVAANIMNRSKTAIFLALVAAFIAGCIVPAHKGEPSGLDLARQLNEAFVAVAEKVSPAVVVVVVTEKPTRSRRGGPRPPDTGEGSGIIVTEDGYILTNNHVVDNADTIEVTLQDGRKFKGEVKGTDPKTDIAVVKIKPTGPKLTVARLGDSDKLRVGEFVVAIGHPYSLAYSVTVGHVSAIERQLLPDDYEGVADNDQEYIQTDAVINPGNSGGPLINLNGEIIGVNAMIEAFTIPFSRQTINRGIGLAIPINEAKAVKDRLISDGKFTRSRIGIEMVNESKAALAFVNLDAQLVSDHAEGVKVQGILTDGPAEKAGLKAGDIIVAVDGTPVRTDRELKKEVSFKRPGQNITVSVLRDNKRLPIKVTTEAVPAAVEETVAAVAEHSTESDYGFSIKTLTKELAGEYGVDKTSGVIVTGVQPFSPFSGRGGIVPGDRITKMNNKAVGSAKEFAEALKALAPGQQWTMELEGKSGSKFKVSHAPSE